MTDPEPGTAGEPGRPSTVDDPAPMSRMAMLGVAVTVTAAGAWFYVSYQVLDSPFIDAVGETLGGMAVVLLLVSIFGAMRGSE